MTRLLAASLLVTALLGCAQYDANCLFLDTNPNICGCFAQPPPDTYIGLARCPSGPATLCCANSNYPREVNSFCSCETFACDQTPTSCSCSSTEQRNATATACSGAWLRCCLGPSRCTCSNEVGSCPAATSLVSSCSAAQFACGSSSTKVNSCDDPFN